MAETENRKDQRTPVTLKIKFKSETLDQFVERYSVDVSHGGIFIRTKDPLKVGTQLRFEFQLKDESPLILGDGTVVWTREHEPDRAGVAPGMGVRFDKLLGESRSVLDKILKQKAENERRASEVASGFNEQPTRVAPTQLVSDLAGGGEGQGDRPGGSTVAFQQDIGDFPEEAFEESTKVASLRELVAQSSGMDLFVQGAGASTEAFDDPAAETEEEIAAAQKQSSEALDREAALEQSAVSAHEASTAEDEDSAVEQQAVVGVDTNKEDDEEQQPEKLPAVDVPSETAEVEQDGASEAEALAPEALAPVDGLPSESESPVVDELAMRRAAVEQGKRNSTETEVSGVIDTNKSDGDQTDSEKSEVLALPSVVKTVPQGTSAQQDPEERSGSAGIAIFAAVVLGGAAVGGYLLWQRSTVSSPSEPTQQEPSATTQSSIPVPTAPDSPTPEVPPEPSAVPEPGFEIRVDSIPTKAQVSLVGTSQNGRTPFTFRKLAKDKTYQVRVSHPGYITQEIPLDVRSVGPMKVTLKAMPRQLRIESRPPGATVYVDRVRVKGVTPINFPLTGAHMTKDLLRVQLRKRGYQKYQAMVPTKSEAFAPRGNVQVQKIVVRLEEDRTPQKVNQVSKPPVAKPKSVPTVEPKPAPKVETKPPAVEPKSKPKDETKPPAAEPKTESKSQTQPKSTPKPKSDPKSKEGPTPDWMR